MMQRHGAVAAVAPNVITVRTADLIETARHLLGRALQARHDGYGAVVTPAPIRIQGR
ncbi:MAG: hypothetical protein U5S82_02970 [Gammaproteobacteria bacterium]|nr:hypothetical protein [Gammaproteobacteria bacterium]